MEMAVVPVEDGVGNQQVSTHFLMVNLGGLRLLADKFFGGSASISL
jgi:hypothetical protein